MLNRILSTIPILLILSGCSVYMAAKKDGVDISDVQKCNARTQFLNLGAKILNSERFADGTLVEVYQVSKEKGSAIRAIMHGLLDISTGFCWELVGTPIEAYMSKREYVTVKVTYGTNDVPIKVEIV